MKCLVIEDNNLDIKLLTSYIKRSRPNAQITICRYFNDALKILYRERHDVIFLDLNLPDNWGISSIKDMKEYSRATPIIVTTGFTSKVTIEEAKKAGAALIFEKRNITSDTISNLIGSQEMVG